jgi:hypothetical protein
MSVQNPQTQLAPYVAFDKPLQELYERLGQVVLVPFADDGKALAEPRSFEATQTAAYLRQLSKNNVAVRCGTASGNLCAITFPELQALRQFLDLNQALRETALLSGPGGLTILFRIDGFRPVTTSLPNARWHGEDAVVPLCLRRPFTKNFSWRNNHSPVELEFSDIEWEECVAAIFKPQHIAFIYGDPFIFDSKAKCSVNFPYWAAGFAAEWRVKYCPDDRQFYSYDDDTDSWATVSVVYIQKLLLQFLVQNGKRAGNAALQQSCNQRQLREMVGALRLVAASPVGDTSKLLKEFIENCLEGDRDSDVTGEELYRAFRVYCERLREPLMLEPRFQKQVPGLIEHAYQIGRSNSIIRDGACRRGYHNLRLKLSVYSPAADVSQPAGTAGTAGTGKCTIRGT